MILGLTIVTALVSLAGVVAEMAKAKALEGRGEWQHIALAGLTVILSWTFTHTMFAIHYATNITAAPRTGRTRGSSSRAMTRRIISTSCIIPS